MSLGEYMPKFEEHKVDLERFLELTEEDLQEIGIKEVGDELKTLNDDLNLYD